MFSPDVSAAEQWLAKPFEGVWPFPLSRKGCKVTKTAPEGPEPAQSWRPTPGCSDRRRHRVLVIRGFTQLAFRLRVLVDRGCKWMLRATRNSDGVRYPSDRRHSTRTSARRLVRGAPAVDTPGDFWPGSKARNRPSASCPYGEPQAEPSVSQKAPVVLKRSLSRHAKSGEPREEFRSPPVVRRRAFGR